jgi:hypothetical protein
MRKTDQVSQDKPEIRLHRYEHILAVKWPTCALADDLAPARTRNLPRPVSPAARTDWNRLVTRQPPRRGPLPPMSVPMFPAGLVSGKGRPACLTRVGVLRLVEPTAFRADAVRPAGRVADFLMPGGWR